MNSSSRRVRTSVVSLAVWLAILGVGALGAGCKQGLGERCQISADCDDGLICAQSEPKVCGGLNEQQVDAYIPVPDPIDAPVDTPPVP